MSLASRAWQASPRTGTVLCVALLMTAASPVAAQTKEQIAAEPVLKLQPGETLVPGQCLSQQELDLIDGLNALRRPTVGVEGADGGDDMAPFNPDYFVGRWEIDGVLPESDLLGSATGALPSSRWAGSTRAAFSIAWMSRRLIKMRPPNL